VRIGLLCSDMSTMHTLPHKRPAFVGPPNSLIHRIFRKTNYGQLTTMDLSTFYPQIRSTEGSFYIYGNSADWNKCDRCVVCWLSNHARFWWGLSYQTLQDHSAHSHTALGSFWLICWVGLYVIRHHQVYVNSSPGLPGLGLRSVFTG